MVATVGKSGAAKAPSFTNYAEREFADLESFKKAVGQGGTLTLTPGERVKINVRSHGALQKLAQLNKDSSFIAANDGVFLTIQARSDAKPGATDGVKLDEGTRSSHSRPSSNFPFNLEVAPFDPNKPVGVERLTIEGLASLEHQYLENFPEYRREAASQDFLRAVVQVDRFDFKQGVIGKRDLLQLEQGFRNNRSNILLGLDRSTGTPYSPW